MINDKSDWTLAFSYSGKSKAEILRQLFSDKKLKDSAFHIASHNSRELIQETFLYLQKQPDEKIIGLNDNEYLLFYTVRAMRNQYNSTCSSFYRLITKQQRLKSDYDPELILSDTTDEDSETGFQIYSPLLPYIKKFIQDNLHWYDRMVFLEVTEPGGSVRKTARRIGIPHSSIQDTMKKVRNQIKEYLTLNNYFQNELDNDPNNDPQS